MNYNHPDLVKDWKQVCERNSNGQPCSSGFLKKVSESALRSIGHIRKFKCLCLQHDFDYEHGPKHGVSKWRADWELAKGTIIIGMIDIKNNFKKSQTSLKTKAKSIAAGTIEMSIGFFGFFIGLSIVGWPAWNKYRRAEK